jgi:hypothetical protein
MILLLADYWLLKIHYKNHLDHHSRLKQKDDKQTKNRNVDVSHDGELRLINISMDIATQQSETNNIK